MTGRTRIPAAEIPAAEIPAAEINGLEGALMKAMAAVGGRVRTRDARDEQLQPLARPTAVG